VPTARRAFIVLLSGVLALVALTAAGFHFLGHPPAFACGAVGRALLDDLERNLDDGLGDMPGYKGTTVGQCYEGGHDGVSVSFDAAAKETVEGRVSDALGCVREQVNAVGEAELRCSASSFEFQVAVGWSIGKAEVWAFLAADE
jgi:hypothetical protein